MSDLYRVEFASQLEGETKWFRTVLPLSDKSSDIFSLSAGQGNGLYGPMFVTDHRGNLVRGAWPRSLTMEQAMATLRELPLRPPLLPPEDSRE